MILRYLTTVLVITFCAGIATEGLDGDRRFDSVIAVYHFEDVTDSGPRGFDGDLLDSDGDLVTEASIVDDGKIDKCLQNPRRRCFWHSGGSALQLDGS